MLSRRRFASFAASSAVLLGPRVARAEGKTILMLGSSTMAGGFGLYLGNDLEREHGCVIDRRGKPSTGLSRPDFHDWIREGRKARDQAKPDIVMCLFGGNDGQGLYMGGSASEKWIRWGEPNWVDEYRRRVNDFADAVAPEHEWLLWIGMPQVKSERLLERVAVMNGIYEQEMALRPNARFISTWDALTVDGKYSDHLLIDGVKTRVRVSDGVHCNPEGAHLLADFVRPAVAAVL